MRTHVRLLLVLGLMTLYGCSRQYDANASASRLPPDLASALAECDIKDAVRVLRCTEDVGEELLHVLEAKARSDDKHTALLGVTLLGRIPNRGQYRLLQQIAAQSKDRLLRCQAMYSMGLLQDPRAAPFFLEVLTCEERDEYERWTAAGALGILRDGIVDDMPLFVFWYVLIPEPDTGQVWPLELPTLDGHVAEFTKWWKANGERLLAQQRESPNFNE